MPPRSVCRQRSWRWVASPRMEAHPEARSPKVTGKTLGCPGRHTTHPWQTLPMGTKKPQQVARPKAQQGPQFTSTGCTFPCGALGAPSPSGTRSQIGGAWSSPHKVPASVLLPLKVAGP